MDNTLSQTSPNLPLEQTPLYKNFFPSPTKDISLYTTLSPTTLNDIISIINTKVHNRTFIQNAILYDFFKSTTHFHTTILSEDITNTNLNDKLLFFFLSQQLEIQFYPKGDIVYYEGTRGDNIYLLLNGSVDLLKTISHIKQYTMCEYYLHLYALYSQNEVFILDKTIDANRDVFPVNKKKDINNMKHIIDTITILNYAYNGNVDELKQYIIDNKKELTLFNFNTVLDGVISVNEFYSHALSMLNESENYYYNIYTLNARNRLSQAVHIFTYETVASIKPLEYFGNYSLFNTNDTKRKDTAIFTDHSTVITINKKQYGINIITESKTNKDKEIDYVHQNSFFKYMRKHIFTKLFFPEMDIIECNKGEHLYNETDRINYIYIIKDGTFELTLLNKTIIQVKSLIMLIKSLHPELTAFNEYDDVVHLKNSMNAMMTLLQVKRNYVLYKTNSDVFGLFESENNMTMMYNVTCVSDKAKVYRIRVDKLKRNDNEDKMLLGRGIRKENENKMKQLLKRLIMIKNNVLLKVDVEFAKKTKQDEDRYYNQVNNVNSEKNKVKYKMNVINDKELKKMNGSYSSKGVKRNYKLIGKVITTTTCNKEKDDMDKKRNRVLLTEVKQDNSVFTKLNKGRYMKWKCNTNNSSCNNNSFRCYKGKGVININNNTHNNNNNIEITTPIITNEIVLPRLFPTKAYLNTHLKHIYNITTTTNNTYHQRSLSTTNNITTFPKQTPHLELSDTFIYDINLIPKHINYLTVRQFYNEITKNSQHHPRMFSK